ncbi:hypothetical protein IW262DRAFT_1299394 [Armillaria fumosa]|nr:hypothetical protein IW262DRAFT_1299394 [Armillaria fumosa]
MTYPGVAVHTSFNPRVPHPSQSLSLSSRMVSLSLSSFVAYTRHSQAQKVPKNSMVVVSEVVVKGWLLYGIFPMVNNDWFSKTVAPKYSNYLVAVSFAWGRLADEVVRMAQHQATRAMKGSYVLPYVAGDQKEGAKQLRAGRRNKLRYKGIQKGSDRDWQKKRDWRGATATTRRRAGMNGEAGTKKHAGGTTGQTVSRDGTHEAGLEI